MLVTKWRLRLIRRPPDVVGFGLRLYPGYIFYLSFLSAIFRADWTELNQNLPHVRKWVRFENECPKFWVSSPTKNRSPKPPRFSITPQLNGKFNGECLCSKTWYRQSRKSLKTARDSLHRPRISWTLVHKRLEIGPMFCPPFLNSAFCIIDMLCRRRSANEIQSNFAKRQEANLANKLL